MSPPFLGINVVSLVYIEPRMIASIWNEDKVGYTIIFTDKITFSMFRISISKTAQMKGHLNLQSSFATTKKNTF